MFISAKSTATILTFITMKAMPQLIIRLTESQISYQRFFRAFGIENALVCFKKGPILLNNIITFSFLFLQVLFSKPCNLFKYQVTMNY